MAAAIRKNETEKKLRVRALKAREKAYAPYSKFKVGSAIKTRDGSFYTGCNVENASYGATVCAERTAILKAASEGHKFVTDVYVMTDLKEPVAPCALCLQMMAEFCQPGTKIWIGNAQETKAVYRFSELLPQPFGPKQLRRK